MFVCGTANKLAKDVRSIGASEPNIALGKINLEVPYRDTVHYYRLACISGS